MIYRIITVSLNVVFFNLVIVLFTLPLYHIHFSNPFIDVTLRSWFNESLLLIYYFLWTNFWYIWLLVIFIFKLIWNFKENNTTIVISLISFMFMLLVIYSSSFYFSYSPLYLQLNYNYLLNNLLYNPFNKIHPFIFYLSTFLFIYIITSKNFNKPQSYNLLLYLPFSLLLGSWWALQEGSWGGWWNWDISEIFGLIFFILFLFIIHINKKRQSTLLQHLTICFSFTLSYTLYLLLQLSFTSASHNFGLISPGSFIFISYNLIILIVLVLVNILLFKFLLLKLTIYFGTYSINSLNTLKYILISLLTYSILYAFSNSLEILPIFGGITIFLIYNIKFKTLSVGVLVLLISLYYISLRLFVLVAVLYFLFNLNFLLILLLPLISKKKFDLMGLHGKLFIFLLYSLTSIGDSSTQFYDLYHLFSRLDYGIFDFFLTPNFTLDISYFFYWTYSFTNSSYFDFTYNFSAVFSKLFSIKFILPLNLDLIYQNLTKLFSNYKYLISFTEYFPTVFLIYLIYLLLNLYIYKFKNFQINN
uniref:Ccmf n=1 Tax=Strombidium cf. sulcatum TaxID=2793073 RepID=A0A7T0M4M4_9SPIT|nr:ccmf [Strombidium cf. sulcatum]QPL15933.1 ccmf [Strombidium cf. sulcatum]